MDLAYIYTYISKIRTQDVDIYIYTYVYDDTCAYNMYCSFVFNSRFVLSFLHFGLSLCI